MTLLQASLIFGAAVLGGAINSLAGGGTLLTFPVLIGAGLPALAANATNTLAMVPGARSSALGYLAALGVLGMTDSYQMNGLKSVLGSVINGIAAIYFVRVGLIDWPAAGLLTLGAIIGNYASAGLARRIGRQAVRRVVIAIGLAMTVSLLIRR